MDTSFFAIPPGRALEMSIGVAFVAAAAYSRFNRPVDKDLARLAPAYLRDGVRTSTTRYRFLGAVSGYVCVNLLLYYLLVADERWRDAVLKTVAGSEELDAWRFSVPLFSALLLTVLAPKAAPLSSIDHNLRRVLQRSAAIPHRVQHEIARLKRSARATDPVDREAIERVKSKVDGQAYDALLLTTSLLRKTEGWAQEREFAGYSTTYDDVRRVIQERFDETLEALDDRAPLAAAAEPRGKRKADETILMLRDHMVEYVARGLLSSCATEHRRIEAARKLGFDAAKNEPSLHAISLIFVVTWAVLVAGYLFLRPLFGGIKGGYVLYKCATISSYLCASVWVALLLRNPQPLEERPFRARPFGRYLLAGLAAAAVCLFLSAAFKLPKYGSYTLVLQDIGYSYPWQALGCTLGFATALAFDSRPRGEHYSGTERARLGLWIGTASAAIGYVVVTMMTDMREPGVVHAGSAAPQVAAIVSQLDPLPASWIVACICLLFGVMVGVFVPGAVHSNRMLFARNRELQPAAPGVAVAAPTGLP